MVIGAGLCVGGCLENRGHDRAGSGLGMLASVNGFGVEFHGLVGKKDNAKFT